MQIYLTTNLINGKKYIGRDANDRNWYLGSGTLLRKAISKYGAENFKKEILEFCETKVQMIERERWWIKHLNAVEDPNFYNISYKSGGMGIGDVHKDSTKKKISLKCKGLKLTVDQRERLAIAARGRTPHNKGKIFNKESDEYKKQYVGRKKRPRLTKEEMKAAINMIECDKVSFTEVSLKFGRCIKQNQINAYKRALGEYYA